MVISADDGRECCRQIRCDPDGVGRNGRSRFFEFGTDVRIGNRGWLPPYVRNQSAKAAKWLRHSFLRIGDSRDLGCQRCAATLTKNRTHAKPTYNRENV
jgi:hypothetical protein